MVVKLLMHSNYDLVEGMEELIQHTWKISRLYDPIKLVAKYYFISVDLPQICPMLNNWHLSLDT